MSKLQMSKPRSCREAVLVIVGIVCAIVVHHSALYSQAAYTRVHVQVQDANEKPLEGVTIRTNVGSNNDVVTTSHDGTAVVRCPVAGTCTFDLQLDGYFPLRKDFPIEKVGEGLLFQLVTVQSLRDQQVVAVRADASPPLLETQAVQTKIQIEPVKLTPLRPATLIDTLPLIPGVSRTSDGRVIIEGSDEAHSTLLVNSVNVTDPATGGFGLSVPVDSVETVRVSVSPFLAQYGSFTSGVVSAETRRGGEKWTFSLNDPLPEFRIRSGHLRGLRSATPRINFSGPLVSNRIFFLEGAEFLLNKASVRTLPFPLNQTRSDAFNSFTQLDDLLNASQTITATYHVAPHSLTYVNLNFFDPEPVTPNADYYEDTATVAHRWAFAKGLLTSTASERRVTASIAPQSPGEMTLTPLGNLGSYFGRGHREAVRYQWMESWAPESIEWRGTHRLALGSVLARARDEGSFAASTTSVRDLQGDTLKTISFSAPDRFDLADFEAALFVQDHWMVSHALALDLGLRAESQTITHTRRLAPRAGFTLIPGGGPHNVIRGGAGVFYREVPLNYYAFKSYPAQTVTVYDSQGNTIDGPRTYLNEFDRELGSELPFLANKEVEGNFAPYSIGWNIEFERSMKHEIMLRARFLHNDLRNQIALTPMASTTSNRFVLSSNGRGLVRQLELTAGYGQNVARQFFLSYVHQIARGDQTDASAYLGDFPYPVVHSLIRASNPGEIPNRLLFWGTADLPYRMHIAPHIEARNGFPFEAVNQLQEYTGGTQNQLRFPLHFSADATLSKDVNVTSKHAVRFSLTGYNLTNHDNPLQVHSNSADPQFRQFFGNYGRHLVVDFDFLF